MGSSNLNTVEICSLTVCLAKGGSDLGMQLFIRGWQHLAVLSGEVVVVGEKYFVLSLGQAGSDRGQDCGCYAVVWTVICKDDSKVPIDVNPSVTSCLSLYVGPETDW